MRSNIKKFIVKHKNLYIFSRWLQHINDLDFYELLRGYYESDGDALVCKINNYKQISINPIIYEIFIGTDKIEIAGFCAVFYQVLLYLDFAYKMNFVPYVFWGPKFQYYDEKMCDKYENAFEYYFEPIKPDGIIHYDGTRYPHLRAIYRHTEIKKDSFYESTKDEDKIKQIARLYTKYIHLNIETKQYLVKTMSPVFDGKSILGVHFRGTDFKQGLADHPVMITVEDYIESVSELFSSGEYDAIFIATDDSEALERFKYRFGEKLLFYDDVLRSRTDVSVHNLQSERPLHHYKLGLEIIRDVYSLACCDGLVCGMSNVSFMARYVNVSIGKSYKKVVVLDHGLYEKDSVRSKYLRHKNHKEWNDRLNDKH